MDKIVEKKGEKIVLVLEELFCVFLENWFKWSSFFYNCVGWMRSGVGGSGCSCVGYGDIVEVEESCFAWRGFVGLVLYFFFDVGGGEGE